MDCKKKALELVASSEPPCNSNGRKKGYMSITEELWEQNSFASLNLSHQNLRDQAARIECSMGNVGDTIQEEANVLGREQNEKYFITGQEGEQQGNDRNNISAMVDNLHKDSSPVDNFPLLNTEAQKTVELARPILASVIPNTGDFSMRAIDTRTKKNQQLV